MLACIPARVIITLIAIYINKGYLPFYGLVLLGPALGFLYLYFSNLRLKAPEAGGITWWANLRIVHGLLYLTAAILAFQKDSLTWTPLAFDVIFGLLAFINHHLL
jgi:hypothetical protein